jgi:hypothetical protein
MLKWSDFWDFEPTCFEKKIMYVMYMKTFIYKLVIELAHQGHTRAYLDIPHLEFKLLKHFKKPWISLTFNGLSSPNCCECI